MLGMFVLADARRKIGVPIHPPPKMLSKPHYPLHHHDHHHHQNDRASCFTSTYTVILPAINTPLDAVS
jgi:hypothetical protein